MKKKALRTIKLLDDFNLYMKDESYENVLPRSCAIGSLEMFKSVIAVTQDYECFSLS